MKDVLEPGQLTRLRQVTLQQEGTFALGQEDVRKELKITQEQMMKFAAIVQELHKKVERLVKEAQSGGKPEEIRPKIEQLRKDQAQQLEMYSPMPRKSSGKSCLGPSSSWATDWSEHLRFPRELKHAKNEETTRRGFLEGSAGAGAGHLALSTSGTRPFANILGANERVRLGVIGTGGRATQLMDHLIAKPREPVQGGIVQWKTKPVDGAELVAVADVYGHIATRPPPGRCEHSQVRRLPQATGSKTCGGRDHRGARPLAQADAH